MCRFASALPEQRGTIKRALKDLKMAGENNLLNFKDRKNNNFTHLALKG